MRDRHARAAGLLLLLFAFAPALGTADCDRDPLLADIRTRLAALHAAVAGHATLTDPLDLADEGIANVASLLAAGAKPRQTKRRLRGVGRRLRAFRRHVQTAGRHGELSTAAADDVVAHADDASTVVLALLESIGSPPATCPTTSTTVTTTSTTSTATKTTQHTTSTLVGVPPPTLDFTKPPTFGEQTLAATLLADPVTVPVSEGTGNVDVSYLGGHCRGFATTAPDVRIQTSDRTSLLRLYFVGTAFDPTIVVNDPFGNFDCVDDSFGTSNPTIDFNDAAAGTYDVWIGSFTPGGSVGGTLFITEESGNHP